MESFDFRHFMTFCSDFIYVLSASPVIHNLIFYGVAFL